MLSRIRTVATMSLSATGSRKAPKDDTVPYKHSARFHRRRLPAGCPCLLCAHQEHLWAAQPWLLGLELSCPAPRQAHRPGGGLPPSETARHTTDLLTDSRAPRTELHPGLTIFLASQPSTKSVMHAAMKMMQFVKGAQGWWLYHTALAQDDDGVRRNDSKIWQQHAVRQTSDGPPATRTGIAATLTSVRIVGRVRICKGKATAMRGAPGRSK